MDQGMSHLTALPSPICEFINHNLTPVFSEALKAIIWGSTAASHHLTASSSAASLLLATLSKFWILLTLERNSLLSSQCFTADKACQIVRAELDNLCRDRKENIIFLSNFCSSYNYSEAKANDLESVR